MKDLENQAFFWQKMDTLYLSSDLVITNQKGSCVKDFPDLVYPCDFGYLKMPKHDSEGEIKCFRGTAGEPIGQVVICANIIDKCIDVRLLIGCTDDEQYDILRFLNSLDQQKAILVRRTDETPSWSLSEE